MLEVQEVEKSYGDHRVLDNTSIAIGNGRILVIIGLNGSGKSTLMKIITGILACDNGCVRIDGKDVSNLDPEDRNIGYVPQSTALFNHLNVQENITYSQKNGRGSPEGFEKVVSMLNLTPLLAKKPNELSGGYRARVALARALYSQPSVMLLDEPLTEVDHAKKEQVLPEFKQVLHQLNIPVLYITHDPREAELIGDTFAVMYKGKLKNIGTTEEAFRMIQDQVLAEAGILSRTGIQRGSEEVVTGR
jgi:molybdate transport system ATP-binding protein